MYPFLNSVSPNRPFLIAYKASTGHVIYFRPRCKLWSCPHCAKVNALQWKIRGAEGVKHFNNQGKTVRFLTLTSHERLDEFTSLKVWPSAWKKLHTRANRKAGEKGSYLMIPERHKDGRLHMHALVTWPLPERFWKDDGRACGLGYMNDLREIDNPGLGAWYVSKYLAKEMEYLNWPAGWRRVRTSRDWPKAPEMEMPEGWTFRKLENDVALIDAIARQRDAGKTVYVLQHDRAWEAIAMIDNAGEAE